MLVSLQEYRERKEARLVADEEAWQNTIAEARKLWESTLPWYLKNKVATFAMCFLLAVSVTPFIGFFVDEVYSATGLWASDWAIFIPVTATILVVGFIFVPFMILEQKYRSSFKNEYKTESYILELEDWRDV